MTVIDAYVCNQPHYLNHLAPVWRALAPDRRGAVYLDQSYGDLIVHATGAGIAPADCARGKPPDGTNPTIVAGGADIAACGSRPVVMLEHGAGQTYVGVDTVSYSGGAGRDRVALFICPNEMVAVRNHARYPTALSVVVGAPHIDRAARRRDTAESTAIAARLAATRRSPTAPVVAVTFHWDAAGIAPEAGTGWHTWSWPMTRLAAAGYNLLGHAHPRIAHELIPWWEQMGVPAARDARTVLRLADVVVADNTSMLYDAARLDIPVVVLDCPFYRRDVDHGLRFWKFADVGIRISDPAGLADAIDAAIADPPYLRDRRRAIAMDVYPWIGDDAAGRAAAAIMGCWPD